MKAHCHHDREQKLRAVPCCFLLLQGEEGLRKEATSNQVRLKLQLQDYSYDAHLHEKKTIRLLVESLG